MSGKIPKMTLDASTIENVERKGKYLKIRFNKKHLLTKARMKELVNSGKNEPSSQEDNNEDAEIEWSFKCTSIEEA